MYGTAIKYNIPRFKPAPKPPSAALSSATALHMTHCASTRLTTNKVTTANSIHALSAEG